MHVFAFTALKHSSSCSLKLRCFLILILLASTYATGGNAELIKKQEPAKHLNQSISDTASISIEGQAMPVKVNVSKPSFEQSKVGPKKRVLDIPLPVDTRVAKPKQQSKASTEQAFKSIDVMKDLKKSSRTSSSLKSFTTNEKKHKAKPTVTIGDSELDKPIPASPTKTTAGEPRKVDYIVPMLITVSVLPFLGMTLHILYKQGKDYWDKRHYRRMDFLINGMYNE